MGMADLFRKSSLGESFISAEKFLSEWDERRVNDLPGVYTILIYDNKRSLESGRYSASYAGQSVKVNARVHNHLLGKGNGDVYADFRGKKVLMIRIEYCDRGMLNDLEKKRIAELNPRTCYNQTIGGGALRDSGVSVGENITGNVKFQRNRSGYKSNSVASIFVDGVHIGELAEGQKDLKASIGKGIHVVKIKADKCKEETIKITIDGFDIVHVNRTLMGWSVFVKPDITITEKLKELI